MRLARTFQAYELSAKHADLGAQLNGNERKSLICKGNFKCPEFRRQEIGPWAGPLVLLVGVNNCTSS